MIVPPPPVITRVPSQDAETIVRGLPLGSAIVDCHTGPAARSFRSHAKKRPSLFVAPTNARGTPPMVAVKSVGVAPKSMSPNCCRAMGTVQLERIDRSLARSLTIEGAKFWPGLWHEFGVPVVT